MEYVSNYHSQYFKFLNFVCLMCTANSVIQIVISEYFTGVRNLNISKDVAMITESQNA